MMGVLAGHDMTAFMTGDVSLVPRDRDGAVSVPLLEMGARILARDGGRLPLAVVGASDPMPIEYCLPVPSAQVKSAVLLAGPARRARRACSSRSRHETIPSG